MLAICIESSHQRGLGHLFRCILLVRELERRKEAYIVLMNPDTHSQEILDKASICYRIVNLWDFESNWELELILEYHIDIWLNDRMGTDYHHAIHIKSGGVRLCAIDDTGTGAQLCDLNIIPIQTKDMPCFGRKVVYGVQYFILNPEISQFKRTRTHVNRIIVSLGGSDTYGITVKVARYLLSLKISADIVLGPSFSHEKPLRQVLQNSSEYRLFQQVPSLPSLFYHYDVAVTGGGCTPFEAASGGLPCIIIANEPHEKYLAQFLDDTNCAVFTCEHASLTCACLHAALKKIKLPEMSLRGQQVFGFRGTEAVLSSVFDNG